MWTAKRILILIVSLLAAVSGFAVYYLFLGLIDGVQPLPLEYLPPPGGPIIIIGPGFEGEADKRLKQAFGPGCKELQRPLRLWLPDKGIAFAAGSFDIGKIDGKVLLAPFSAAFYHKSAVPGAFPEISTIRCDMAILTLDRPVSQISELNNRKVIAVEMVGGQPNFITINNNRRTAEKNDDIDVLITNGPLFYEARRDLIFTEGVVCLTDHQAQPPTVISGRGLDLYLAKDANPNRPRPARPLAGKPNSETGGIEKIALRSDVDMKFWVDANSGFLGGNSAAPKPQPPSAARPAKADKELIHIHTGGPFLYDLTKEIAWFESPPSRDNRNAKGVDPIAPAQVHVHRVQKINGGEKFDQLTCDRLDLQFRRRLNPAAAAPPAEGGDKEIETALATRRDANLVILSLDSEGMEAYGNEMFYRAGDAANGALTILKGDPLRTAKDGHKMVSKELHLFAANRFGEGQRAWAKGPGQIDLLDNKDPNKNAFPTHVRFRDTLTSIKTKEGGQVFDLLTVIGEASFIDDQQEQELHGEKIEVWLLQVQESVKKAEAIGGGRQDLRRVRAQDRVRAISPEFIVRRTNDLTMIFIPEVTRGAVLPELKAETPKNKIDPPMAGGTDPTKGEKVELKPPVEEKKPPRPIELEGNTISVAIFTFAGKKQLQELIAKGNVYVVQAGEKPGTKALDITGHTLTVNHFDKGDTMVVYGEKNRPARVEADDTVIVGPKVTINQGDNRAEVDGNGSMDMPSNKNIDGTQSSKKNSRITIHWNKNMTFDGKHAVFQGGVEAVENGAYSRALCQVLTAILDQTVSFKEGKKDKQSAKLDRLVFDKNVFIDDCKVEKNLVQQHNQLQAWILYNQDEGPTVATGPGWIKLLAKGSPDPGLAQPPPGVNAKPAAKTDWKLTHVKFSQNMNSKTVAGNKKTIFYGESGGVEVFHFPTVDINEKLFDPNRTPKDGMYLRCGQLEVEGKQTADRTTQIMIATQNVEFRTDQYLGYADIVKYDEANDLVIFEAIGDNRVRLYEFVGATTREKSMRSSKVLYNRKTGQIDTEGVKSIRSN